MSIKQLSKMVKDGNEHSTARAVALAAIVVAKALNRIADTLEYRL